MNSFRLNLSKIQKICLSGVLCALATILQKVVAVNYIASLPFLRVSFGGPAIIIFVSIALGPIYGMAVGAFSDLLGYFLFDPKNNAFFPQITLIYLLLGFVSYFVYKLVCFIKKDKIAKLIGFIFFICLLIVSLLFVFFNKTVFDIDLIYKIIILVSSLLLSSLLVFFVLFIDKKYNKEEIPVFKIAFANLIIDILVMVIFGTIMKGWAFGFNIYPVILTCQILVLFVNVCLNTFLISLFIKITKKYRMNNNYEKRK